MPEEPPVPLTPLQTAKALSFAMLRIAELKEALEFYADPENYHAIGFLVDSPAGLFAEDFSDDHGHPDYERPMPGKRARAVLDKE